MPHADGAPPGAGPGVWGAPPQCAQDAVSQCVQQAASRCSSSKALTKAPQTLGIFLSMWCYREDPFDAVVYLHHA